ncbi:MAG TPA: TlpA disulfide reductase family protein [Candidatus Limnocylindrales bacterium]|nr:TlpA disulfide reductase family protein [Candidatus Limnocylindrales bacterium]
MRLPDFIGVLGALVVGGLLTVFLLASAIGEPPALPTSVPPTIPPLPTPTGNIVVPSALPSGTPIGSIEPGTGTAIGQRAPAIELTLTDGSLMNTADFGGQPMWVNFMATWCPQCQDELPMMERFQSQLAGKMTLLVVDVGEDRRTVNAFMRQLDVDLTVGLDEDGSIQSQWGAYALPIHFWLDADGIVREIVYGGAPEEIFLQAITAVVPEFSAEE